MGIATLEQPETIEDKKLEISSSELMNPNADLDLTLLKLDIDGESFGVTNAITSLTQNKIITSYRILIDNCGNRIIHPKVSSVSSEGFNATSSVKNIRKLPDHSEIFLYQSELPKIGDIVEIQNSFLLDIIGLVKVLVDGNIFKYKIEAACTTLTLAGKRTECRELLDLNDIKVLKGVRKERRICVPRAGRKAVTLIQTAAGFVYDDEDVPSSIKEIIEYRLRFSKLEF